MIRPYLGYILVTLILMSRVAGAVTIDFFVDATTAGWQDTGITLTLGATSPTTMTVDPFSYPASGLPGEWSNTAGEIQGQGMIHGFNAGETFLLGTAAPYSLVGVIIPTGDPFDPMSGLMSHPAGFDLGGGGLSIPNFIEGQLYLGFNDNDFTDNSGGWSVTIISTPEPTTFAMVSLGLIGLGYFGRNRKEIK